MTLPAPQGVVLFWVFLALVGTALVDLVHRFIPNWLVATLGVAGLTHALVTRGAWAAAWGTAGAVTAILILAIPFSRGALGGGDVKLVGALGCWVGPLGVLVVLFGGVLVSGILGLAYLLGLSRAERDEIAKNLDAMARGGMASVPTPEHLPRSRGIPFGVALAASGAWMISSGLGH